MSHSQHSGSGGHPGFPKDAEFVMEPISPDESKKLTVIYALYSASFLLLITFFVALIFNVLWKDEFRSELARLHARWQMRTALFGFLWGAIGTISIPTPLFFVAWLIIPITWIWLLYRLVRGWLALSDNKPPKPGFGLH